MHPECQKNGCYMFEEGTEWHKACLKDCRLLRPPPKVTQAGILKAMAAGWELGIRQNKNNEDDHK